MLKKITIIIFLLFFITPYTYGKDKLKVVTSIAPLAFFIENIGGDRVDVTTLIPPGGNPHTYEPTPRQMNILSKADLFVKVGSGIEFELIWMKRIEALNRNMPVCDASKGVTLIDTDDHGKEHWHEGEHSHHGKKDPHIWLSPFNAIIISQNIQQALTEIDPSNSAYYNKKLETLIADLKTMSHYISENLKDINTNNPNIPNNININIIIIIFS